jgi:hypothetical protein
MRASQMRAGGIQTGDRRGQLPEEFAWKWRANSLVLRAYRLNQKESRWVRI